MLALLALALPLAFAPQAESSAQAAATQKPAKALPSSPASADPALAKVDAHIEKLALDKSKKDWKLRLNMPPELTFDAGKDYFWHLRTNKGDIKIRFMPDVAPVHVSSSLFLIRSGFYDDLIFHRVISRFMAQGGCPLGTGTGGPAYKYSGETNPKVKHDRPGLLSMANTGRPQTDGSQFFLTFVPTPWLDNKHTIFGEVVEGMDVLKKLEKAGSQSGRTSEPLKMISNTVTVAAKKKAAATPAKAKAKATGGAK